MPQTSHASVSQKEMEEEKTRIEAEYREVLKSSVAFEKKIRNR